MLDELTQHIAANALLVFALAPLVLLAYFMPLLVAAVRRHRFLWSIALIDTALGWTFIGWLAAMIWAVNKDVTDSGQPAKPVREPVREPALAEVTLREPSWSGAAPEVEADAAHSVSPVRECSHCSEPVAADAVVCRHCGREIAVAAPAESALPQPLDDDSIRSLHAALGDTPEDTAAQTEPDELEAQNDTLLDALNYARMLEERTRAARTGAPLPASATHDRPAGRDVVELDVLRRTGTDSGG